MVLDLQGLSSVADYFLVCSGAIDHPGRHHRRRACAPRSRRGGVRPRHTEGSAESGWLLLDYGDVVVHVFLEETRAFYALERLWGDAPLVSVEGDARARD